MEDWDERTGVIALLILTKKKAGQSGWDMDADIKALCEEYEVNQQEAEHLAALMEQEIDKSFI